MSIAGVPWRLLLLVAVVVAALATPVAVTPAGDIDTADAEFRMTNAGPSGTTSSATLRASAARVYDHRSAPVGAPATAAPSVLATKAGPGKIVLGRNMRE